MITRDQAMTSHDFHHEPCFVHFGKRGSITIKTENWRRNGKTKTWKTHPTEYRIPVKYGLRSYDYIDHNTTDVHDAHDCPLAYDKIENLRVEAMARFHGIPPFATGFYVSGLRYNGDAITATITYRDEDKTEKTYTVKL